MVSFGEETGMEWDHYCGGAILSESSIATAAHCFFGRKDYKRNTKIRVGDQNLRDSSDDSLAETYDVLAIIKHPEYRGQGPKNDLAIVFTKQKIHFNANTAKIPLLISANQAFKKGSINTPSKFSAWGYFDQSKIPSDNLREADFTMFPDVYCKPLYPNQRIKNRLNEENILCAGTEVSTMSKYIQIDKPS